ncbi:hypothetical protein D8Y22_00810 [Salinadaptatus halalkaliphilus]|uniref:Uncharacterized protein n=1 Tax=Salinadaptatus halalkaliphilus TaxID=2419781 RepID=A0A4S3TTG3_9EURY|nr:hypothetical protein [Salinadaptatus halalkaliphilus]THE66703.1 hypothetical protein D8Y22_00810 [Salinadaptatus halalkaliphilus]
MSDRVTRRRLLAVCGVGVATGLSGCTGSDVGSETETGDQNGTTDTTDGAEHDGGGDSGETQIRYGTSYIAEITLHEAGTPEITQTLHDGDHYTRTVLGDGEVLESYYVDGKSYSIVQGNCLVDEEPAAETSIPDIQSPSGQTGTLSASETTTIDGESVEVYTHPEDDASWYVSTETGYPVQFESAVATVRYHSWGDTDPISPPDMECLEM